mmetsp:Transcript_66835/g.172070  ORF Transcript_66835/g.172070 Transcript_66835/m.172070 type:complete len:416 (-) Transcript_66835:136-1383(-)
MRNIALLEWGPASLFHIQPRERIKVRTGWLEGGPLMPPFLSTMEDAKSDSADLCVRYALSAYEDLNAAIRNLRKCFGFPYQEYVGYLNTLTKTHRVRREHEGLIAPLRRWAIFGNVDAVFWIDYAKANQPPGSFKMGLRDSRPFSQGHMEICTQITAGSCQKEADGDESDMAWSDADDDLATGTLPGDGSLMRSSQGARELSSEPQSVMLGPRVALRRRGRVSRQQEEDAASRAQAATARSKDKEKAGSLTAAAAPAKKDERTYLRAMLQEEVVPGHGSIYQRSMNPGPGYYNPPDFLSAQPDGIGPGFRGRKKDTFDAAARHAKDLPAPGDYLAKPALVDLRPKLGSFTKADKLVSPLEIHKKLPFISSDAAKLEMHGVHGGEGMLGIFPTAPLPTSDNPHAPRWSFSRMRRPF